MPGCSERKTQARSVFALSAETPHEALAGTGSLLPSVSPPAAFLLRPGSWASRRPGQRPPRGRVTCEPPTCPVCAGGRGGGTDQLLQRQRVCQKSHCPRQALPTCAPAGSGALGRSRP